MKKVLLSTFALVGSITIQAQCSDLFISEYVEGYGNNKAIELYNPSNSAIALNSQYRLTRYANGSSEAAGNVNVQASINLGNHVIQPHDAWVIVLDRRTAPVQQVDGPIVDTALQMVADTFLCPVYNTSYAMYFNGNDALALQKSTDGGNTWNYVDIFAQIGDAAMTSSSDGHSGWTDQFPYDNGVDNGTPIGWTVNHTLRRHADVEQGVTSNPQTFIVSTQWDSLHQDTFTGLGTHTCNCPVVAGVNDITNSVFVKMYPNPTNDARFTVTASEKIATVKVYTTTGEEVISKEGNKSDMQMTIETGDLAKGIYIVKVLFTNNLTNVTKLSIQ